MIYIIIFLIVAIVFGLMAIAPNVKNVKNEMPEKLGYHFVNQFEEKFLSLSRSEKEKEVVKYFLSLGVLTGSRGILCYMNEYLCEDSDYDIMIREKHLPKHILEFYYEIASEQNHLGYQTDAIIVTINDENYNLLLMDDDKYNSWLYATNEAKYQNLCFNKLNTRHERVHYFRKKCEEWSDLKYELNKPCRRILDKLNKTK